MASTKSPPDTLREQPTIMNRLEGWGSILAGAFVIFILILMAVFQIQRSQPPQAITSHYLDVEARDIVVSPIGGACYEVLRTRATWGQAQYALLTTQVTCPVVAVPQILGGDLP